MRTLVAVVRSLMMPAGLFLVQRAVAYETEAAEARHAELAELEDQIGARQAELAMLNGVAEPLPEYRRHAVRCDFRHDLEAGCSDPDGQCTELAAFLPPRVDEPPADPEQPAPGPQREDFPPEPPAADLEHEDLPVWGTAVGVVAGAVLAAAYTAYANRRRRRARQLAASLPTLLERRADRVAAGVGLVDLDALRAEVRRRKTEPVDDRHIPDDVYPAGDPFSCPWGCGWTPAADAALDDKRLWRALHGNSCTQRPSTMAVAGA